MLASSWVNIKYTSHLSKETVNGKMVSLIEQAESFTQLHITNAQEKAIFLHRDPSLGEAGGSISSRELTANASGWWRQSNTMFFPMRVYLKEQKGALDQAFSPKLA